ncbi:MAG: hypothetical protein WDN28_13725 [Chthoniobacter sp.]
MRIEEQGIGGLVTLQIDDAERLAALDDMNPRLARGQREIVNGRGRIPGRFQ